MLNSYLEYLWNGHPENATRFELLRESDREAAVAEAIVFGMLQTMGLRPETHDQVGTGGPDFICCGSRGPLFSRSLRDRLVVEATSLNPDAVTERSHIPNEVPDEISGGAFGLVTSHIRNKAKRKASQLGGYEMPRVLAIVSSHVGISALFNSATAVNALVSDFYWKHQIGSDSIDTGQYVSLQNSVFIEPGPDGTIVACRQSISAILLVAVHGDRSQLWGILHPEPAYPLNISLFPDLPFVRLATWPIVDGKITPEWVVAHPRGYDVRHYPVRLPRANRRAKAPARDSSPSQS